MIIGKRYKKNIVVENERNESCGECNDPHIALITDPIAMVKPTSGIQYNFHSLPTLCDIDIMTSNVMIYAKRVVALEISGEEKPRRSHPYSN